MHEPAPSSSSPAAGARIEVRHSVDAAYWCRVFDVSHRELCHAVQQVGPQVAEVRRYLSSHAPVRDTPRWTEDSGF